MSSVLRQRIVTGSVLAAVVVLAIAALPPFAFVLLLAAVTLLACWEWSDLAGLGSRPLRVLYCAVAAAGIAGLLHCTQLFGEAPQPSSVRNVLAAAALWWLVALVFVKTFPASAALWGPVPARLLMGLFTLLPAWLAFAYLRAQPDGEWKIVFVVALVAAADIGAYFSGSKFGRRKLAPAVSPGKSWEGFWGGLAAALLFAAIVHALFWHSLPLGAWLLVAAFTVLASVLGDLHESMVKRQRGVKDSGRLLPGHGGLMDRLDSISAALPVFVLGLLLAR